MGWVALGWGEPLTPRWGRPNFIGKPWWGGWGGPRVVNDKVVHNTAVIDVNHITYSNAHVNNAFVSTTHEHFGNGRVHDEHVHVTQPGGMNHILGALPVKPGPESLVASTHHGTRPPETMLSRPVVATRPPHESKLPWRSESSKAEAAVVTDRHFVLVPKRMPEELSRPAFGVQTGSERVRPSLPPRFMGRRHEVVPQHADQESAISEFRKSLVIPMKPRTPPSENRTYGPTDLPGKPANRLFQNNEKNNGNDYGSDRQHSRQ